MQEEVENRTVAITISAAKFTSRLFKAAICKSLEHRKNVKVQKVNKARASPVIPHGKQTVNQLVGQNQGVSNIEISDNNIKDFDPVARYYANDYAVKKDKTGEIPKYLVFFKARDGDARNAAFREYTADVTKKREKPSIIRMLRAVDPMKKELSQDKVRKKDKELSR